MPLFTRAATGAVSVGMEPSDSEAVAFGEVIQRDGSQSVAGGDGDLRTGKGIFFGVMVIERNPEFFRHVVELVVWVLRPGELSHHDRAEVVGLRISRAGIIQRVAQYAHIKRRVMRDEGPGNLRPQLRPQLGKRGGISNVLRINPVNGDIPRIKVHRLRPYEVADPVHHLAVFNHHQTHLAGGSPAGVGGFKIDSSEVHQVRGSA